ncbi:MAG: ABC transporter ATP-binding protein [Acidimicrobiales bacterium]
MLAIDELTVAYGPVQALTGVSLVARAGSITAVLGANGAGKTTLLRSITGLVRPRSGKVTFDGSEITALRPEDIVRLGIAHVPEGRGVITELTVDENIRLGALFRKRAADHRQGIERAYDLFPPLASRRSRPAATLSGGERQMLAIGRALVSLPRALVLDEPSLGLAPIVTAQLMKVIRDLARNDKMTVLLVEQNARSALSIADSAVVLSLGRTVISEAAETLASEEALRRSYLGF